VPVEDGTRKLRRQSSKVGMDTSENAGQLVMEIA
jgi:hypothetical protein